LPSKAVVVLLNCLFEAFDCGDRGGGDAAAYAFSGGSGDDCDSVLAGHFDFRPDAFAVLCLGMFTAILVMWYVSQSVSIR
jgi:hypothetical protein